MVVVGESVVIALRVAHGGTTPPEGGSVGCTLAHTKSSITLHPDAEIHVCFLHMVYSIALKFRTAFQIMSLFMLNTVNVKTCI